MRNHLHCFRDTFHHLLPFFESKPSTTSDSCSKSLQSPQVSSYSKFTEIGLGDLQPLPSPTTRVSPNDLLFINNKDDSISTSEIETLRSSHLTSSYESDSGGPDPQDTAECAGDMGLDTHLSNYRV